MKPTQHPIYKLACAILMGSTLLSAKADYPTDILAQSPVAYWRLNENVAVPAADVATNIGTLGAAQKGYYKGGATHPVDGALAGSTDTAAILSGAAGSVVSVPYTAALNPSGAFTVEAWLNPGAEMAAGGLTAALASGVFSDPRSGWLIYQSDTGWVFRTYNKNGTATSLNISSTTPPVPGTWYHIVAVFDGLSNPSKLYVNGVEAASGTPTGYVAGVGGEFFIGGRSDSAFWWNGSADEVAFYGSALSPSTVLSHYQNGTNSARATPYEQLVQGSSPLLYLRLNEPVFSPGDLPVAVNAATTGNSYDGTYNPGVDAQVAGPRPPSLSGFTAGNTAAGLNGNAGAVTTPYSLNEVTAFTVSGWLKRGTDHSVRGGYFGQNDLLEIGDADGGTNIEVWVNAFGASLKVPYSFADNQWGLLTIVGEPTKVSVYENGTLAGSVSHAAVASFGSSAYAFNIGGGGIFNATGDYFRGSIDEVAVFDKALTANEVQQLYFGANVAPVITKQPTAPTRAIVTGNVVTLSVETLGTSPISYQWRKGGQNLTGQTSSTLTFNSITAGDAGSYDVVVTNPYGSVTSGSVTLAVGPTENVAPTIQYADSGRNFTTIRLFFSEPLDPTTAQNKNNYTITDGTSPLAVVSATLASPAGTAGDNMVDLVTAPQTPGKTYTVTVNGVKDQTAPGNTIAANSTIQVKSWTLATGYLRFEHYDNLPGAADTDLMSALQDPRVIAGTPTTEGFLLGKFDTRTIFADDTHETYLGRATGWIVPTETGDYDFFLKSDDAGRLYLSTTEAMPDPVADTPIAIETGCCGAFYEPGTDAATTAAPIHLEANQRYGVVGLVKENGGGDYLQVAWRKTTDTTPAANLTTIPGQFLQTYVDPNVNLSFTAQPTDQAGVLPSPIVDFVTKPFSTDDGGFTVVNTDPAPPGPWVYDGTAGVWTADGSADDCTGPYNSKLTSPAFTVPVNDEVTLTFSHRYSFEPDRWDGGQVWISVNGGTYTPVSADNFTANGYPAGLIQGSGVINGQRAFHDESAGYATGSFVTSSVILGRFNANDTISVQFVGAWDDCSNGPRPSWVVRSMALAYGTAARASTFTAAATATKQGTAVPFTYQWQRNDGSGFVDMPNETAATLRIFPTAADFGATFRVLAKVPGNELISNVVKLTGGTAAPDIAIAKTAGTASITFTGRLQSSPTVNGTYNDVNGAQSPYTVPAGTTMMFYRSAR